MNVIFTLHLDKNGLLELRTAPLRGRDGRTFTDIHQLIHSAKRIVITAKSGSPKTFSNETCLCFTVDPTYKPPTIRDREDSSDLELKR